MRLVPPSRRPLALLVGLLALCGGLAPGLRAADLTYQGRLTESDEPVNGPRNFVFTIRDAGGERWTSGSLSLAVADGLYAIVLTGIDRTVLESPDLVLRVAVEGTILSPDVRIVPAVQAAVAFGVAPGSVGDAGLAATGVGAGTYTSVTVNAQGRVTAGTHPTTLAGYGVTDAVASGSGGPTTVGSGTGAPAGGVDGDIYVKTDSKQIWEKVAGAWTMVAALGTGAVDADASTNGVVRLAGDLAGTAASPRIAAGAIVDADVNASAAIAFSKIATPTTIAGYGLTDAVAKGAGGPTTITSGTAAASGGADGDLYTKTDSKQIWQNIGGTWTKVAELSAGAVDATGSANGVVRLAGDLAGTAASPRIAAGAIVDADVNAAAAIAVSKIAAMTTATTTATTIPGAINELNADIGSLSGLTTTAKSSLAGAVNELNADVGGLSSLTTTAKSSIVAAINEVNSGSGSLSGLTTTDKSSLAGAINELNVDVAALAAGTGLADGAVTDAKLHSASVTTATIANGAVTDAKIAGVDGAKVGGVVNADGYHQAIRVETGDSNGLAAMTDSDGTILIDSPPNGLSLRLLDPTQHPGRLVTLHDIATYGDPSWIYWRDGSSQDQTVEYMQLGEATTFQSDGTSWQIVATNQVYPGSVSTGDLADESITNRKLAWDAVENENIRNGSVSDSTVSWISGSKIEGGVVNGDAFGQKIRLDRDNIVMAGDDATILVDATSNTANVVLIDPRQGFRRVVTLCALGSNPVTVSWYKVDAALLQVWDTMTQGETSTFQSDGNTWRIIATNKTPGLRSIRLGVPDGDGIVTMTDDDGTILVDAAGGTLFARLLDPTQRSGQLVTVHAIGDSGVQVVWSDPNAQLDVLVESMRTGEEATFQSDGTSWLVVGTNRPAVTHDMIANGAVGSTQIDQEAVRSYNIATGAVTNDKVANGINGSKIEFGVPVANGYAQWIRWDAGDLDHHVFMGDGDGTILVDATLADVFVNLQPLAQAISGRMVTLSCVGTGANHVYVQIPDGQNAPIAVKTMHDGETATLQVGGAGWLVIADDRVTAEDLVDGGVVVKADGYDQAIRVDAGDNDATGTMRDDDGTILVDATLAPVLVRLLDPTQHARRLVTLRAVGGNTVSVVWHDTNDQDQPVETMQFGEVTTFQSDGTTWQVVATNQVALVTNAMLGTASVATANIADGAVTDAKLATTVAVVATADSIVKRDSGGGITATSVTTSMLNGQGLALAVVQPANCVDNTYAVGPSDATILGSDADADFTVVLPPPDDCPGRVLTIKKITSCSYATKVVPDALSGARIDGVSVITMSQQFNGLTIQAFQGQWYVLSMTTF